MTATWDLSPMEEAAADAAYWNDRYAEPEDDDLDEDEESATSRACDCGSCCLACGHDPDCNSQTTEDDE